LSTGVSVAIIRVIVTIQEDFFPPRALHHPSTTLAAVRMSPVYINDIDTITFEEQKMNHEDDYIDNISLVL
jgi:hypothetical protein